MAATDFLLFFVGGLALFVALLILWVIWKPLLAVVNVPERLVRSDVTFRIRSLGYPVETKRRALWVRIDSLSALKIYVRSRPRGTEIRYDVDATTLGWVLVFLFMMIPYGAFIALILGIVIHVTSSGFAKNQVASALHYVPLGTLPRKDTHSLLIEGLSEAQRLASEALATEREAMQNGIVLIVIGAVVLWAVLLVVLGVYFPLPVPDAPLVAAVLGGGICIVAALLGSWSVRMRNQPTVRALLAEVDLYGRGLANEIYGARPERSTQGALELVLRAAERSAYWREVRRRRGLWRDPIAGFTVFLYAFSALLFVLFGVGSDALPLAFRVFLVGIAAGLAFAAVHTLRSWKREMRERDESDRRDWEQRRREIEAELWKILSG